MSNQVIISCEHGGNQVPQRYSYLFAGAEGVLNSHRGWDPGALEVAETLSSRLDASLFYMPTTRLLIEMNRSLHSPELFSEFSRHLDEGDHQALLDEFYFPYRLSIESMIAASKKPVLHLSIHSFTPVWQGTDRGVDIGLLFDPDRESELVFSELLKKDLTNRLSGFVILANEPYHGTDDGLTTHLRQKFPGDEYLGIEIEINQKFAGTSAIATIQEALIQSVRETATRLP